MTGCCFSPPPNSHLQGETGKLLLMAWGLRKKKYTHKLKFNETGDNSEEAFYAFQ